MGGLREPDILDVWLAGDGRVTLDRLLAGSPDVLGVMDHAYVVRWVNWTTPGLPRELVVGHDVFNLVPPDDRDNARAAFDQALRHGKQSRFEMFYRGEHGVLVWNVRVGPIVHDGKVIGALTVNTDVTEERRDFLDRDRFFSLSLDMLVVATSDGRLRRVNPAFSAALGYDVAEIVGTPFIGLVHPHDVAATEAALRALQAGRAVEDFEARYRRSDGSYRTFSWRANLDPLTNDVYAVARDVTDHRNTEAHLRHAQKMEAVGQLAGGVAHDFNNLMQAVLSNVEIAQGKGASPEVKQHLADIADASVRAAQLTKQLLVFSRSQPLHRVPVDVNELLQGLMRILQRLLPENITIELRTGTELPSVDADLTQLEQVVLNMCVNARDAMPEGGRLTLETDCVEITPRDCELHPWAKPGRFVRLIVTDTGEGMTPEVRERVFDPFFTTKGSQRGTGLGLATVYGIVRQHGGLLHVYSEVGQGATFKVYLPALESTSKSVRTLGDAGMSRGSSGHGTILIAEDDEGVRKPLIQVLASAGYRVLVAANGNEAIATLKNDPNGIDLVVLDVVMPELGGPAAWEIMRVMRPGLHVIFTSGYADDRYRDRLPANEEVLDKPFSTALLLERVRQKLVR